MLRTVRAVPMLASLVPVACGAAQDASPRFERVELEVGSDPHVLAAELTGDCLPDLAVAGEGRVLVLAGDGDGGFRRTGEVPAGENPTGLAASDLDGDGDVDLAAANHETDHLTLLLNDGGGAFGPAPASPVRIDVDPHPHTVAAADLDGDGRTDLLVDHRSAGGLLPLYRTEGEGYEPGEVVLLGGDPYRDVVVADLDGDGRDDLAVTSWDAGEVVILRGRELGASDAPPPPIRRIRVGEGPWSVSASDFDADGRDDLAVAVTGEERVVVLLSRR